MKLFEKDPYSYSLTLIKDRLFLSWARRGTVWTYEAPRTYKNTYRKDMLFSVDRTYVRNLRMYIYMLHIGPLKIDYIAKNHGNNKGSAQGKRAQAKNRMA